MSGMSPIPGHAIFRTAFGLWLERHKIEHHDAAEILDVTRPYVSMLATGAAAPSRTLACAIEDWSRSVTPDDVIDVRSWDGAVKARKVRQRRRELRAAARK